MAGHSKWAQIKRQKGTTDVKRGQVFSKLLKAISLAAKTESHPQFNPRLRSAIEKAKENNVPQDNINQAINKAAKEKNLAEIIIEAYGPEGVALIIEGISDNTNRTVSEIKHLLLENNWKNADPGSVIWSFESGVNGWKPKFKRNISETAKIQLQQLIKILERREDVQKITANTDL